jgi:hypothetical protein
VLHVELEIKEGKTLLRSKNRIKTETKPGNVVPLRVND